MLYPEINKLRDAAGSRYFLVTMASKRARDLIDGYPKLDPNITTNKPVSIAAEEIAEGLFTYQQIPDIDEQYQDEADDYNKAEYCSDESNSYTDSVETVNESENTDSMTASEESEVDFEQEQV